MRFRIHHGRESLDRRRAMAKTATRREHRTKNLGNHMISRILFAALLAASSLQQPQKITINFPTRSGASWPLFIAKEGGYYQKYGLDVNLVFAGHPAGVAM